MPDNCAENLSNNTRDDVAITLQGSDQSEPTEEQTVTLPQGNTDITTRFRSRNPAYVIETTVTAVRVQFVGGETNPISEIAVTNINLTDGTKADDIPSVSSTSPTSGMFRLEQLRETPVESFVITVPAVSLPGGDVVVEVGFDGCVKSGKSHFPRKIISCNIGNICIINCRVIKMICHQATHGLLVITS